MVEYTSETSALQTVPHNLGVKPGFIITKNIDGGSGWWVYHTSIGNDKNLKLDEPSEEGIVINSWRANDTDFAVNSNAFYGPGPKIIAYLFAEDTPGMIKCDKFTTNSSGLTSYIDLGFEPQWILMKQTDTPNNPTSGAWMIWDRKRGSFNGMLSPNTNGAEVDYGLNGFMTVSGTSFKINSSYWGAAVHDIVYVAIAEPPAARSLTTEELDAQKLKFLTYQNRKEVVCGEEAAAAREALLATLTEAGYTEADINQTYSNLDN